MTETTTTLPDVAAATADIKLAATRENKPNRRSPFSLRLALLIGLALILVGGAAWFYQLSVGFLQTANMSNAFPWGLGIGIFAFLVGFAAGGQLLSSYAVLRKKAQLQDYAALCAAIAFSAALAASVAVLADLGNIGNVLAMIIGPHLTSPLVWDMVALTVFILVALVNFIILALPAWTRSETRIGTWLAKRIKPERADTSRRRLAPILAVIGIIAAVALQIVEGLIFSLQAAHVWWNTPLLPVDFIAVSGICGSALLLLVLALTTMKSQTEHSNTTIKHVSRVLVVSLVLHFAIVAIGLIGLVTSSVPAEKELLALLSGDYAVLYAAEIILPIMALVLVVTPRLRLSRITMAVAALLTTAGILAHRMMLLYGAYAVPSLLFTLPESSSGAQLGSWGYPISTGFGALGEPMFAATTAYVPTMIEVGVALLPLGIAVFASAVLMLLARAYPAHER